VVTCTISKSFKIIGPCVHALQKCLVGLWLSASSLALRSTDPRALVRFELLLPVLGDAALACFLDMEVPFNDGWKTKGGLSALEIRMTSLFPAAPLHNEGSKSKGRGPNPKVGVH
jgi:hypothetical protein